MAAREGLPLPFTVQAVAWCPFCFGTGVQTLDVSFRLQAANGHADITIQRKMPCTYCTTAGDWLAYEDMRRRMEAA